MSYGYSNIIVEKGIPIPKSKRGRPKGLKTFVKDYSYLMDEMEIGDSFSMPLEKEKDYNRYFQSVMDCARRSGIKMTCRNLETEIRFWKLGEK